MGTYKIGPLALAVLGLLDEAPRHPYDIAFTMQQRHMSEHIKLSMGSLYHVVEQLQRLGWIQPLGTVREGRRPERTVYAIAPDGQRALHDRLRDLIATPAREHSSFEAGLSFLYLLSPEEAVLLLRKRATRLRADVEMWGAHLARLAGEHARLWLIEAEMVLDSHRAQADWSERIANEIESGAIEWCRPGKEEPVHD